jgi:predicted nucleic acid-binding protein
LILVDTSGLLAVIDDDQLLHQEAVRSLRAAAVPRLLSPFVLGELDYMLSTRVGRAAQHALLEEVARGAYRLEAFVDSDIGAALEIMRRYNDLDIGLADASIVVLAERHGTRDVLTLDERHFRKLSGPGGAPFRLLPADVQ